MQTIEEIAKAIVAREGGYVDDPDDPGGVTKHGVTLGTLKRLGLDLTGDGAVNRADVSALTRQQATAIFIQHYYRSPGIDRLPEPLRASVFDMYVNAGANAVKLLQRLLRDMGHAVAVDGQIGPQTERAGTDAMNAAPNHLVDAYGIARRNYYYRLADARPASRKFACARDGGKGGWILRAEDFIAAKYHLSEAEHRERVSRWA